MTAIVTRGDAANLLLPDECVDLIVTSPPYFGLRSYQDGGEHYEGQVGDEATPAEYLDALIRCTAEWMRVLKPGGSIFVNLGDKYSGAQQQNSSKQSQEASSDYWRKTNPKNTGIPAKSLMGFPWRYALRCIDELGLILRAEIVWAKPNGLPESVTDRVRRSHEQVFHFVKAPRYYSAVDEVRESHQATTQGRSTAGWKAGPSGNREVGRGAWDGETVRDFATNPLGKLPGSVWNIPTSPLRVPESLGIDHFAAFPGELVRRIVLGWSPREVCTACGEGRRPVSATTGRVVASDGRDQYGAYAERRARGEASGSASRQSGTGTAAMPKVERLPVGYACACPDTTAPATPGVVLDPFGGTGTTALVASCYGRVGISVDLSADYCRLARWRTTDPGERARVLGVPKPEPVAEGQMDMFGEWSA